MFEDLEIFEDYEEFETPSDLETLRCPECNKIILCEMERGSLACLIIKCRVCKHKILITSTPERLTLKALD